MLHEYLATRTYRLDFQSFFETEPTDWITFDAVKNLALQGKVKADTLVLREGAKNWAFARDLPEVNDLLLAYKIIVARERDAAAREREVAAREKRAAANERDTTSFIVRGWRWLLGRNVSNEEDQSANPSATESSFPQSTRRDKPESRSNQHDESTSSGDGTAASYRPDTADQASCFLYLVRLTYEGITYAKIGITKNSADNRYSGHAAEMEIVDEWELPTDQIARQIEQHILNEFGDYRAAAPNSMDGYTETFSLEHESPIRAEANRMVNRHKPQPRRATDLIFALRSANKNRDAIKAAIGKGGQRLRIEYRDSAGNKKTMFATITGLNGRWLRVYDNHDPSNLEKSIAISKIDNARLIQ